MGPEKRNDKGLRIFSAGLALGFWELAARAIHNRLLLVGPVQTLTRLLGLLGQKTTWQAIAFTFSRIGLGFFLAFFLALVLAGLAAAFPWAEVLLRPYVLAIQSVPVASFIVIALLWLSGKRLSTFISFLMVLPVLYSNALQGLKNADPQLKEMAKVFRVPILRQIPGIYLPALAPTLRSGCRVALGMCFKSGVAAEVIAVTSHSIGGMLYDAKVYLEISDLFAWTLIIVMLSLCFEKVFLWLLDRVFRWIEKAV